MRGVDGTVLSAAAGGRVAGAGVAKTIRMLAGLVLVTVGLPLFGQGDPSSMPKVGTVNARFQSPRISAKGSGKAGARSAEPERERTLARAEVVR